MDFVDPKYTKYTITLIPDPAEGGSVDFIRKADDEYSSSDGSVTLSATIPFGTTETRTAKATSKSGYYFSGWYNSWNGNNPISNDNQWDIELSGSPDQTYYAKFSTNPSYEVTFKAVAVVDGTETQVAEVYVDIDGEIKKVFNKVYNQGASVTAKAHIDDSIKDSYSFSGWYKNGVKFEDSDGILNQLTITVGESDANAVYTAKFTMVKECIITVESNNDSWGAVAGGGIYPSGTQINLSATPNSGYHFTKWSDGNTDKQRVITVTEDATYTAIFKPDTYTIIYKDQGNNNFSGTHASGYPAKHTYGTITTLKTASKTGYTFIGWFNNSNCTGTALKSLGATSYTSDIILYAKWEAKSVKITLKPDPAEGGTVMFFEQNTGERSDSTNGDGSVLGEFSTNDRPYISANPEPGYNFTNWTVNGNVLTDQKLYQITPLNDTTYTANFEKQRFKLTVEANPEIGGSIIKSPSSDDNTYEYNKEVVLNAKPAVGYSFIRWNDDITDNPRTVFVTEDATYKAEFKENLKYTITVEADPTEGGTVTEGGEYYSGVSINLSAIPNSDYLFNGWTYVVGENTTKTPVNPLNITVTGNADCIAHFKEIKQDIPATENKISTNKYIKDNILNIYSGYNNDEDNKCPTKKLILERGGNAISIIGNYTDNQCVKETDITCGGRNAVVKIGLKGGTASRSIETFEIYNGAAKTASTESTDRYNINEWYTIFNNVNFVADKNNQGENIYINIGSFNAISEIYSYFGTKDPDITGDDWDDWINNEPKHIGQLGYTETATFDCLQQWDDWIKGDNNMYIIIVLH